MNLSKTRDSRKAPKSKVKQRTLNVVVGIGVVLAVLGVATVAVNLFFFSRIRDVAEWDNDVVVPGGFFGMSPSEIEQLSFFLSVPGVLFLLALCFIMTGRVLRGQVGTRITTGLRGGTVVSSSPILSARAQATWIGVALALWFLLIVVPLVLALGGGWPATVDELPQVYVWLTLGMYGALASAIAGVLAVSQLKKKRYLDMIAAEDRRLLESPVGIWRWLTYRWRFDLWLGGVGGAVLGSCWLALFTADIVLFLVSLVIGCVVFCVGVWMARQYWKAGMPLGIGESFV
ncbi:hypothetical protein [Mycetocola zhujimingii]|uniref:hypothetical protein n=1 Tax=Mycetocola zhujimingii TaxID=2079792 RepID=UPI0013C4D131|nr:hypothetical protein [Mycetocola zhujimingii]